MDSIASPFTSTGWRPTPGANRTRAGLGGLRVRVRVKAPHSGIGASITRRSGMRESGSTQTARSAASCPATARI